MKTLPMLRILSLLAVTVTVAEPAYAQQAQAAGPIRAYIRLRDVPQPREYLLVGRDGTRQVLYRPEGAPEGATAGLTVADIEACEFVFDLDGTRIQAEVRARRWIAAAQVILSEVVPALPLLHIPNNNAVDPTLRAGSYLMRAAYTAEISEDETHRAGAEALYRAAHRILAAVGRAGWHPRSESAASRGALALIRAGDEQIGFRALDRIRVPIPGDASFGAYWLAKAQLAYLREDLQEALDSAIRSYIYENKDVDSFPEALLLAAQCYEDLLEPHRTRDLYYEVARLFRGTEWGTLAFRRLKAIMDGGLTEEEEPRDMTQVFFGIEEDVNALARELIEEIEGHRRDAYGVEIVEDEEEGEAE